jgi:DNA-binding Lrp family transcriptional regulator
MTPIDDIDRAASVLADATVLSDRDVAKKYGIHRNTVLNYRKRLETDEALRQAYASKIALIKSSETWESMVPDALKAGLRAMMECFDALDRSDPDSLEAIVKSLSAISEIRITLDMIQTKTDDRKDRAQDAGERTEHIAPPPAPAPPRFVVHAATA